MNALVVTTFLALLVVIAAGGVVLTLAFVVLDRIGLGGLMEADAFAAIVNALAN